MAKTPEARPLKRIYYGWGIVAISIVANTLVLGSTYSAFGLFVLPISAEYHLSRADMNTALVLLTVGGALSAPLLGRMLDRFAARRIMLACALIFGLGLAVISTSRSLWVSGTMMAVPLAAGVNGAAGLTMNVLTARWFTARRGRAMALSVLGQSLASIVMAPIVGLAIEVFGWRGALLTIGAADAALLVGMALLVREQPSRDDVASPAKAAPAFPPSANAQPSAAMGMGAVLRSPQFWLIALGSAAALAIAQTLQITLVPLARGGGLSLMQASSLVSAMGLAALGSKLLLALAADKIDRVLLLSGMVALGAPLNAALLISDGYLPLLGCAVVLGVITGALAPTELTLMADRFGAASFGTVRGLTIPIGSVLTAVGVRLAGEVFDRTGGYDRLFVGFIGAQLIAALLILATRLKRPASPTGRLAADGAQ